jgi:protease-4
MIRLATILVLTVLAGCTRLRFVIDVAPREDELTESVVMGDRGATDKIALVDVTGLIINAPRPGFPSGGENPVARFSESLRRAAQDSRVKALVVRINSPGGSVTASDLIYREIARFRKETGKPVVVLMDSVAASGGLYAACAADEVIAHPTTITGSIGVIVQTFNFSEGMRKVGIGADAITSGPNKAMGSPFAPMPPEHRALLQQLVDEFHGGFRDVVVRARPALPAEDLQWIADGRVLTGRRAAEVGLVDRLGSMPEAFEAARTRAGLSRARLVKYHRPLEYVGSPYASATPAGPTEINLLQVNLVDTLLDMPGFYYLWVP